MTPSAKCRSPVSSSVGLQVGQRINGGRRTQPTRRHHGRVLVLAARAGRIILPIRGAGLEPGPAVPKGHDGEFLKEVGFDYRVYGTQQNGIGYRGGSGLADE